MCSNLLFSIVYIYYNNINGTDLFSIGCELSEYDVEKICSIIDISEKPILINTCAVTESAYWASLRLCEKMRMIYPQRKIYIVGCGVDYKSIEFDKLGIIYRNKDKFSFRNYGNGIKCNNDFTHNIFDNNNGFIKIQDGCKNNCSYCIIPKLRTNPISTPYEEICKDIECLLKNGKTEISLVGTEVCTYSYNGLNISSLIEKILEDYPTISMINFNALDPSSPYIEKIIDIAKRTNRVTKTICLSLQSGSDTILKLMNRRNGTERMRFIKKYAGDEFKFIWHLIIGFPGETDELFDDTISLIRELKPYNIAINPYSDRVGTIANNMDNKNSEDVIKSRCKKCYNILKEIKECEKETNIIEDKISDKKIYCCDLYSDVDFQDLFTKIKNGTNYNIQYNYNSDGDQRELELNIKILSMLKYYMYNDISKNTMIVNINNKFLTKYLNGEFVHSTMENYMNSNISYKLTKDININNFIKFITKFKNNKHMIKSIYNDYKHNVNEIDENVKYILEELYV